MKQLEERIICRNKKFSIVLWNPKEYRIYKETEIQTGNINRKKFTIMAKDVNLNSREWTNLIFEEKNKEYGAYVMRETSSDRHLKALIIVTFIGLLLVYLPKWITPEISADAKKITISDGAVLRDITQEASVEELIKNIEKLPEVPIKASIKFTPPVIVPDSDLKPDELMVTQQTITDAGVDISVATIAGEKDGIDIADIIEHGDITGTGAGEAAPFVHTIVEVMPQFPGGEKELMKWLGDHINYPVIAIENGIQGRVVIRFVVRPDGTVDNVEIQGALDPSCDKEAMRVVNKMPQWIPGKHNGNPVYVYYTLPIHFRLQ